MPVNKLIESDSSNLPLRWLLYSSIYSTDSWDFEYSDGYQIVAEVQVREDEEGFVGACVEALTSDGLPGVAGKSTVCHFVKGGETPFVSLE